MHNDFAEYLPVSIGGKVHVNTTGDCSNPENPPLAGVTIHLLDASGNVIDTAMTDADGKYKFDDLRPGTYGVQEVQPARYFSGATFVGSAGGTKGSDIVTNVVLTSGIDAVNYDFCEIPPASISGYVYVDTNNNGIKDPGEAPIPGATLILARRKRPADRRHGHDQRLGLLRVHRTAARHLRRRRSAAGRLPRRPRHGRQRRRQCA